ncbi:hypothetical protein JW968_01335 [Candidatus Woesearchaeota archaeon]|nr:hypothetical protein [Candidatus Woesearchaeota archaeon]
MKTNMPEAAKTLNEKVQRSKAKNSRELMRYISMSIKKTGKKDPLAENSLKFMTYLLRPYHVLDLKHTIKERYEELAHHLSASDEKIAKLASKKIKNGSKIGISSNKGLVGKALGNARSDRKRFTISKIEDPENDIILAECEAVTPYGAVSKALRGKRTGHAQTFLLCNTHKFTKRDERKGIPDMVIISELGIHKHKALLEEIKKYPWLTS